MRCRVKIQRDSKRCTQFHAPIFTELYVVYEWSTYHFRQEVLNFRIPPLERSPSAQPCSSSISWEKNGYYSAQERRPGASVLAPEISWYHTLQLFLVGVRERSSLRTVCTNNFGRPKKPYHNCGEFNEARHSSSDVERIQLPSGCYPSGRRGRGPLNIYNFFESIIKCNLTLIVLMWRIGWAHNNARK